MRVGVGKAAREQQQQQAASSKIENTLSGHSLRLCLVQTLVGDGHDLLQYVPDVSATFVSVFRALEARVAAVGPVLGRLVRRVKCVHPGVAAHAESPAVGGPVARQRLLLQHLSAAHSGDDCCPTAFTHTHTPA